MVGAAVVGVVAAVVGVVGVVVVVVVGGAAPIFIPHSGQ